MESISQEQIIKRFQLLPDALKDAVFSEKTSDAILKNCVLRDIPKEKISLVGQLATRALLGYLRPESFAFEIQKETGIDALRATQIAHDIDAEIFSEVRLELKKLYPPTIQTPTVQSQGFIRSQELAPSTSSGQAKPAPRYVVPIPERFKKTAPWPQPTTDNSKLIIQNEGATHPTPTAAPIANQRPSAPIVSLAKTSPENLAGQATPLQPAQQTQNKPTIQTPPQPASPPMDPVVPLPTFIQSKFKQETPDQPKKEEGAQTPSAQDALKSAFGKFTVSSTATEVKKEPVSPYREAIEEPKKPAEQKPAVKVQGKVIDLSQF